MKKITAFTLAETLIVIGVIGIVSALTLPNLNNSTGDKEKVSQVKKIYQNLNDAYGRAEAVYGPVSTWFLNDTEDKAKAQRAGQRVTEFMKVTKDCNITTNGNCFASTQINKTNTTTKYEDSPNGVNTKYKFITADGTSVSIEKDNAKIIVDIDGPTKGKNATGRDIFVFNYEDGKGIVPLGYGSDFSTLLANVQEGGAGDQSAAWIVNYDNAEYLKANSSGKCKNNTSVAMNATSPTCK